MGLDMYAFKTREKFTSPIGFEPDREQTEQIAYWRKFNNLHGWMERLYLQKGGTKSFNCEALELTSHDLDQLQTDVENNTNLEPTAGFFFGSLDELTEDDVKDIQEFINTARQAIADGYTVYYDSWW